MRKYLLFFQMEFCLICRILDCPLIRKRLFDWRQIVLSSLTCPKISKQFLELYEMLYWPRNIDICSSKRLCVASPLPQLCTALQDLTSNEIWVENRVEMETGHILGCFGWIFCSKPPSLIFWTNWYSKFSKDRIYGLIFRLFRSSEKIVLSYLKHLNSSIVDTTQSH